MASWSHIETAVPDLAAAVRKCFDVRKHATLATLRRDGAPRISGTEVDFDPPDIRLGSMAGAVKAADLRRDPRFALHSPTVDPPAEAPSDWAGEAKIAGFAEELGDKTAPDQPHDFRLDIKEVVLTRVSGDRLEITSWHEGRGLAVRRRD